MNASSFSKENPEGVVLFYFKALGKNNTTPSGFLFGITLTISYAIILSPLRGFIRSWIENPPSRHLRIPTHRSIQMPISAVTQNHQSGIFYSTKEKKRGHKGHKVRLWQGLVCGGQWRCAGFIPSYCPVLENSIPPFLQNFKSTYPCGT